VSSKDIDEVLKRTVQAPHPVDPALLERIARSLQSSMRPVRPLPPNWVLAGGLALLCAVVALAASARAGFDGIEKLSIFQRALIFPTLSILMCFAAIEFVGEMIPGSLRRVTPRALLGAGGVALLAMFALLFRDYHTDHFVSSGITCLIMGLLHAIPTGLAIWFLLRRGFAVNAVAAGLAGGILAGLTGLAVLELHCANFQALHILVWHTAVVPVSGAAGAFLAWALHSKTGH